MTTAFLAHSFAKDDEPTVQNIRAFLESFELSIVTGERPSAEAISEKIKTRISDADIFCVLLTARHNGETPVSQSETSPWLPQELAFATGCRKPLLIFREEGLEVFSGLNSDHEYIEFNRRRFHAAVIKAVPYVLSAIKLAGGSTVDDTGADVIDEFEARRMAAKLQNRCNVLPTQSPEDQNAGFRQALIAFIAAELDGNYSAFLYFLNHLQQSGYRIHGVSRMLFDKYYRMGKEAQEDTRLALRSGLRGAET